MFRSEKTVLSFNSFSSPFNIEIVETVSNELQMELIDLQNDTDLRNSKEAMPNFSLNNPFPHISFAVFFNSISTNVLFL